MLDLDCVTFAYPGRSPIFEDFSWSVQDGESWAVTGPSGCGKSTLLMLLAGLRRPTAGTINIQGQPLVRPSPRTGMIIQDYGLLPWATVRENAALGLTVRRFYGPDGKHADSVPPAAEQVDYWLDRLGLTAVAAQYPQQVSGGQRQRTAIARTLVLQPGLLLMDEPFSSLDAPTREGLQSLVLDLRAEQKLTLVLVTHAIEEAAWMGAKILVLGTSPNRVPAVLENPGAGSPGFRETDAYTQACRQLRGMLEAA